MITLNKEDLNCVGAGNFIIPMCASFVIGTSIGLLSWAIKSTVYGHTDEFSKPSHYLLEGGLGGMIAVVSTLGFILAT